MLGKKWNLVWCRIRNHCYGDDDERGTTCALLLESLCEWVFCWSELLLREDWSETEYHMRQKQQNCEPSYFLTTLEIVGGRCYIMWIFLFVQTCICTDGGVPLHGSPFHAGSGWASGECLGMFLSLPLTDNGLATLPLLHSLLVHAPHLLINLKQYACVNNWQRIDRGMRIYLYTLKAHE